MKKMKWVVIVTVFLFVVTGCAGLSDTQQRTGTGAVAGAAAGAAIGSLYGNAGWGAAIGAAVGGAGGYLYDQHVKSKDKAYQDGYQAGQTGQTGQQKQ